MISISTNKHNRIKQLWISSVYDDKDYIKVWQVIKEKTRQFLSELNLKTLIIKCQADNNDTLQFRNQHWAFKSESLQTALIHDIYTFILTNHTD